MIHKTTRSILSVLLAALLLVTSIPLTPAFADGGAVSLQSANSERGGLEGSGKEGDPYQIATADDLLKFAKLVNDGETTANAVLTADIVLNEKIEVDDNGAVTNQEKLSEWIPIGNIIDEEDPDSFGYTGTFDGDGHTISGLYIDSSSANYQGLFGYVGTGGTVKDLSVSGSVSGGMFVGGIVGYNNGGTVTGCTFSGSGSVSGNSYVGGVVGVVGVVGDSSGTVKNCYNTGDVTGGSYVGGVVGQNSGSVENSYNTGNISGDISVGSSGGVVGWNSGSVENCYNTGSVTSSGSNVGGVVGYNVGPVKNCYNTGTVTGTYDYVGGVVGKNRASVTNCYNTGTVTVTGTYDFVGGVVGHSSGGSSASASVTNCYNTGSVSGNSYVGGVVGYSSDGSSASASVTNCYNTGRVSGDRYVGGVVGDNRGTVTGCYFLQTDGVPANGIGGGETTGATAVNDLNALCKALTSDTTTWTTSPFCKHPVLQENPEGGLGTATHPYEIKTAAQLKTFRDLVNREGGNPAAHAKLMNDIDLKDVCGKDAGESEEEVSWEPIGTSSKPYTGTFNGAGHTISGLYIDRSDTDYQGLFGRVNGGTVQNLSVSGSVKGDDYVGGVVGQNGGSVENCYNTGAVNSSGNRVGGVVGYNSRIVKNCYNTGAVNSSGNWVGGVVGVNSGSVTNCYNTVNGTVTVTGNDYVGGVVGYNSSNGTVENCYNTVKVTGSSDYSYIGGVVGYNSSNGNVENCYNTGTVSGSGWYVGGVVGQNFGTVENCYNTDAVNSSGNRVGGVVGDNGGTVKNCYNTGSVSGTDDYVGGVAGYNYGSASVANCYYQTGKGATVGVGGTTKDDTTTVAKTAEQFASGEVAYLLQSKQTAGSSQVWGQAIGEDDFPVLSTESTKTVYRVPVDLNYTGAQADQVIYTNSTLNAKEPTREGYTFDGWYDSNGNPVTAITATTTTLYAKWIEATPEPTPDPEPEEPPYTGKYSYEVSTSVGDNGAISVDRYATEGDKVTIDVTPDQAYKLDELVVTANGKEVELTANGDGTYTFTMPSADVRISATFAEDPDWTEPEEPATDVSDIFIDIAPDAWYKDAVQYAYDNGLMTGVSATEFAPEQTTTRAMIVSILARLENVTTAEAAGFADVDDNDWYATAVNWAANVGVVNGYEDNTFQPNTAITREQLAAILMNYAAYKGEDVSNRADLTSYTDQPSTWAQEAMQWAVAEGLISGVTNDQLQPQGNATRAQVAAILQRFLDK